MPFIHLFRKMEHWNLDIIGYWVIEAACLIWKGPGNYPQCPKLFKRFLKIIALVYIHQLIKFCHSVFVVQKIYSKMHPASRTNFYDNVTDLVIYEMVTNTETWISWERNITFLQNKKFFNLLLRWHILRSYRFLAETTFNNIVPLIAI